MNAIKECCIFTKEDTTIAKFLAIILMFAHHLFAWPDRISNVIYKSVFISSKGIPIEYNIGIFGKICVAIFMVLSGYGIYTSFITSNSSTISITKHKLIKLYIVFWKVFIVFIPLGVILNSPYININFKTLLCNFFGIQITYNGEWWFLTPYIGTLIILPFILKIVYGGWLHSLISFFLMLCLPKIYNYLLPLVLPANVYFVLTQSIIGNIFRLTLNLLPYFVTGCLIAKHDLFNKYLRFFSKSILSYIVSFFIIIVIYNIRKKTFRYIDLDYILAPPFIIASVSLLRNVDFIKRLFLHLGSRSTEMWLIHSFFCYQFCQRLVFVPLYSPLILIWLIIMSFGSSVIINTFFSFLWKLFSKVKMDK